MCLRELQECFEVVSGEFKGVYKCLKCFKEILKISKGFLSVSMMFKCFKGVLSVVCRIVHGC